MIGSPAPRHAPPVPQGFEFAAFPMSKANLEIESIDPLVSWLVFDSEI